MLLTFKAWASSSVQPCLVPKNHEGYGPPCTNEETEAWKYSDLPKVIVHGPETTSLWLDKSSFAGLICKKLFKIAKSQVTSKQLHLKSGLLQDYNEVVSYFCSVWSSLLPNLPLSSFTFMEIHLGREASKWFLPMKFLISGLIYYPCSPSAGSSKVVVSLLLPKITSPIDHALKWCLVSGSGNCLLPVPLQAVDRNCATLFLAMVLISHSLLHPILSTSL